MFWIRPNEDISRLSMSKEERRKKLDQILEHAGTIEFDLDPETLDQLPDRAALSSSNSSSVE